MYSDAANLLIGTGAAIWSRVRDSSLPQIMAVRHPLVALYGKTTREIETEITAWPNAITTEPWTVQGILLAALVSKPVRMAPDHANALLNDAAQETRNSMREDIEDASAPIDLVAACGAKTYHHNVLGGLEWARAGTVLRCKGCKPNHAARILKVSGVFVTERFEQRIMKSVDVVFAEAMQGTQPKSCPIAKVIRRRLELLQCIRGEWIEQMVNETVSQTRKLVKYLAQRGTSPQFAVKWATLEARDTVLSLYEDKCHRMAA